MFNNKIHKQTNLLMQVLIPKYIADQFHIWSDEKVEGTILKFDGGIHDNPPISPPPGIKLNPLRINEVDIISNFRASLSGVDVFFTPSDSVFALISTFLKSRMLSFSWKPKLSRQFEWIVPLCLPSTL